MTDFSIYTAKIVVRILTNILLYISSLYIIILAFKLHDLSTYNILSYSFYTIIQLSLCNYASFWIFRKYHDYRYHAKLKIYAHSFIGSFVVMILCQVINSGNSTIMIAVSHIILTNGTLELYDKLHAYNNVYKFECMILYTYIILLLAISYVQIYLGTNHILG